MTNVTALRPIERRVRRMNDEGLDEVEIAWRFRRSPRFIRQVLALSHHPRADDGDEPRAAGELRPLERRLLWWLDQGLDHNDLAPRFRRSPGFLRRVEEMARYKQRG